MAAHYGMTSSATWSMGDFNGDGAVNLNDLAILAAHWGDTLSSLPAVPTGLSATATSSSAVSLSWNADSSSGGTITYLIYRNATKINTTTSTTYADSGLTGGDTYSYSIAASNSYGTSNQSSAVDVTTTGTLQPVGNDPGPWNLTFDSEFTGSSLNTAQWSTGWFGSGITGPIDSPYEAEVDSPAQVTVGGGTLNLTAIAQQNTDSNGTFQYTSGVVTTMAPAYPWTVPALFSLTYGYMEAQSGSLVQLTLPTGQPSGRMVSQLTEPTARSMFLKGLVAPLVITSTMPRSAPVVALPVITQVGILMPPIGRMVLLPITMMAWKSGRLHLGSLRRRCTWFLIWGYRTPLVLQSPYQLPCKLLTLGFGNIKQKRSRQ